MEEDRLAELHDELTNGKARRGKLGGIGAGQKHSTLLNGPKRHLTTAQLADLPDRPLYKRFVMAEKKQLCRHTVLSVLSTHGGQMKWRALVEQVSRICGEEMTREFTYKVLVNVPMDHLCSKTPVVKIPH